MKGNAIKLYNNMHLIMIPKNYNTEIYKLSYYFNSKLRIHLVKKKKTYISHHQLAYCRFKPFGHHEHTCR